VLERGADPKPHNLLPPLNPDWFHLSGKGLPRLSVSSSSSSSSSSSNLCYSAQCTCCT